MSEERQYYAEVKREFRRLAPVYDLGTAAPLARLRERVADFAGPRKGDKVLDVATGTGKQAFAFARRGCEVVGVDLSEDMLRIAVRKNRYANVRFQQADGTALPFADGGFDIVCISFGLHEMPAVIRERVLKEVARVARPGGTVVIVDWALPVNRAGTWFVHRIITLFETKYYSEFVKSDLEVVMRRFGIEVKGRLRVMAGAGRVLRGVRA